MQSVPAQAPTILNKIAGTKFKVVAGYRSTGESFLALERGEVDVAATSMDALRSLHWPKLESGELTPIFVQGVRRLKEFPNAPTLGEFGNNEVEKAFLGVFNVTAEVGRSLATPPGIPPNGWRRCARPTRRWSPIPRFSPTSRSSASSSISCRARSCRK